MALSTDTKLFGLDLSAAAGQLRAAWGQLMGLPLLRRSLPAALVRVVKADGGLAHAWVRAGQWHWAVEREASGRKPSGSAVLMGGDQLLLRTLRMPSLSAQRSEEHTSELQSPCNLVCRLLLEKKRG